MINNCKNLDIILTLCIPANTSCRYMADPHSCPNYGEEFMRPYHSPSAVGAYESKQTEVETLDEFVGRTETELNEMSIKPKISERPARPCSVCGSDEWWLRGDDKWVCGRCHPEPKVEEVPDWF